jgi:predicted HAD superfamily Cof-like phosphohydrolase
MEEAAETVQKLTGREVEWKLGPVTDEPDLVGVLDGLCDLICVTYGTAGECGVDLEPFWDEVHRTNLLKANGPVREDGKQLKPPGWKGPDLASILARVTS